jgi:hypothetical protein
MDRGLFFFARRFCARCLDALLPTWRRKSFFGKKYLFILFFQPSLVEFSLSMDLQQRFVSVGAAEIVLQDLRQNSGNIEGLENGLIELYKSVVRLVYFRADLMPEKNIDGRLYKDIFGEYAEAGIDVVLAGLPPSVQLAMYQSLDDDFTRRELGICINDLRNAVPDGVVIEPAGTVRFPDDYNVGENGVPAVNGNAAFVPVPPAFRHQSEK